MQSNSKVLRIRLQGENIPKQWQETTGSLLDEVLEGFYEKMPSSDGVVKVRLVLSDMNEIGFTFRQAVDMLKGFKKEGLDVCVDIFRADKAIALNEARLERARAAHQGEAQRIFLSGWTQEEMAKPNKMIDYNQYSRYLANTAEEGVFSFDFEAWEQPSRKGCGCGAQA